MAPSSPSSEQDRTPGGRLRLAAALGGAGMLAMGLGAGVLQAEGQDGATAGSGADVLSGSQPGPTASAASAAPSSSSSSSTATTAPAAATSSTPVTPPPAAPAEPQPVAEQPKAEAPAPVEQPKAEQAAEPKAEAPKAEEPKAAEPKADQPKAAEPKADTPKAAEEPEVKDICMPGEGAELAAEDAAAGEDDPHAHAEDAAAAADAECEPAYAPKPKAKKKAKKGKAKPKHDKDVRDDHGHGDEHGRRRPEPIAPQPIRNAGGVPTLANPTTSVVLPGPAAIGVPNFFIDKFRIPPFLLPIYQAAGMEYGIRWEILAAINEIETDYGRNLNVSSAGALGWMQFMPATWKAYGVDANGDGRKDPYNPVDAIFAAARYLEAAGGEKDLRKAIFAYNHADWYVDSVLMRARLVGGLPVDLVGSISGLTEGRFPLNGKARYADDLDEKKATRTIARGSNAALPVDGDANRRGVDIYAAEGTQVVATHDGEIVRRGVDERLGTFVQVRDTHGNTYTYGDLGKLTPSHPVPKRGAKRNGATPIPQDEAETAAPTPGTPAGKERLFAHPRRPKAYKAGGARQVPAPVPRSNDEYVRDLLDLGPNQVTWKRLKPGSRVVAGTILGYVGKQTARSSSHLKFEIRPAGRGAPRIDPKPILDGWKLLESTAIYRASNKNPFHGKDSTTPTVGQILLMSKDALQKRVLDNGLIALTESGRLDIRSGRIDRRVLAVLEYLAANGLKPTVSSLYRPGSITTSGNVSHHSVGTAVDISAINGTPVIGNQGKGSITDIANRRLLNLQGAMKPDQIISLMTYPGATNTIAMGDHHDHIHVGFRPVGDNAQTSRAVNATLKPGQWFKVIDRLNEIENPVVRKTPSAASLKVTPKRRAR